MNQLQNERLNAKYAGQFVLSWYRANEGRFVKGTRRYATIEDATEAAFERERRTYGYTSVDIATPAREGEQR